MYKFGKYVSPFAVVFLTHYISANVYSNVCAQFTLSGFLQSLLLTGSPVCGTLLHVVQYTQNSYGVMLAGAGALILGLLTNFQKECQCESEEQ